MSSARPRAEIPAASDPLLSLLRQPVLVVWSLFLISMPFYVGESGLPQPGNALLFLLLPMAVRGWKGRLPIRVTRMLRALSWFTLWVFLVNYSWALINGKWGLEYYVLHPLYYLFNAVLFFTALVIYERHGAKFLRLTAFVIVGVILFQVAASFLFRTELYRGHLFFNNPNQLGYYALLSACLIALLQRPARMGLLTASVALTGCAYLSVLSASRAASAGIGILLVLLLFSNPRLIVVGIIASIGLLSLGGPVPEAIDYAQRRTAEEHPSDGGFVEERAYDRLWEFKEHLLLGAGEGDVGRFVTEGHAREIHSSAATVLFSYGIVGSLLFVVFAVRVVRGAGLRATAMLVPTFAYTIAHQGLRFSMLWVLLAAYVANTAYATASRRKVSKPAPSRASLPGLAHPQPFAPSP